MFTTNTSEKTNLLETKPTPAIISETQFGISVSIAGSKSTLSITDHGICYGNLDNSGATQNKEKIRLLCAYLEKSESKYKSNNDNTNYKNILDLEKEAIAKFKCCCSCCTIC